MSKKTEAKSEAKKLNKLAIKKETINDLEARDAEQVKGGASWTNTCGNVCRTLSVPPACIKLDS